MTLPFPKTPGFLSDEDLAALDEYYCQPYYARDASKVAHIREYDWVQQYHKDDSRVYCRQQIQDLGEHLTDFDYDTINQIFTQEWTGPYIDIVDIFLCGLEQINV